MKTPSVHTHLLHTPKPGHVKALSIRQPWAWLIVNGHKPVENRTWATTFRGPVLIHAGKGWSRREYEAARAFAAVRGVAIPPSPSIAYGGIVGVANVIDCVDAHSSPWFEGPYGFLLAAPCPVPFVPCKGMLGFFDIPRSLLDG